MELIILFVVLRAGVFVVGTIYHLLKEFRVSSWCCICHQKVKQNYRKVKGGKAHPGCVRKKELAEKSSREHPERLS